MAPENAVGTGKRLAVMDYWLVSFTRYAVAWYGATKCQTRSTNGKSQAATKSIANKPQF